MKKRVTVIGAGLAGSEAAWQLAMRGISVRLVEMRPQKLTPAHQGGKFAELVCSNSLGADVPTSPAGILKAELRRMGSLILDCAESSKVPAGRALAVDRERFASLVTEKVEAHPLIAVEHEEVTNIPEGPVIIATGPLTSPLLAERIREVTGQDYLYFFDAVAPVVFLDTVNMKRAFKGNRYGSDGDDYINCPMNEEEYQRFWEALVAAERAPRHDFERKLKYFGGCMPVEVIAERGRDSLRFGPLRPVGLEHPETGEKFYAVVQLRQDNRDGTLYNIVGFQTNLKWGEQERVFRMIPGLENVEFARKGVMHRNIYVNAPRSLDEALRLRGREDIYLAGQITGVEGYMESTAMGFVAALNVAAAVGGMDFPRWPRETALGSLLNFLSDDTVKHFQPMNVNLGIFPRLPEKIRDRKERCAAVAERAMNHLEIFLKSNSHILNYNV